MFLTVYLWPAKIYGDIDLEAYVTGFRGAYGSDFLFMDDNYRLQILWREAIERIPWPAKSPDLNPIENLWDFVGKAIAGRRPTSFSDVNALKTTLPEQWNSIFRTVANNNITSNKSRCYMCVEVTDDHIPCYIHRPQIFSLFFLCLKSPCYILLSFYWFMGFSLVYGFI